MSTSTTDKVLVKNLQLLTARNKNLLKKRIEQWNGTVRMFIHPLYEKWRGGYPYDRFYDNDSCAKLIAIENGLKKLLTMREGETPPIIVFEEILHVELFQQWLSENVSATQTVYVVATYQDTSKPYWPLTYRKEPWKEFIKILNRLDVRKIVLGGMQLDVQAGLNDWTKVQPYVAKCVGICLSYLDKKKGGNFTIELSSLTYPASGRELYNSFFHSR